MRMKILYDHQIFSYQRYGGISRYFFELMSAYAPMQDVDCELAIAYSENAYLATNRKTKLNDIPWPSRSRSTLRFLVRYLINRQHSKRAVKLGAYDVFHPTFFDRSFVRVMPSRPFVLTLMDMTPEMFPELFPCKSMYERFVTAKWIKAKRHLAQRATKLLAISQRTKDDAVRLFGIDPARITVTHLASSFDPSLRAKVTVDIERPYLLYVGTRSAYKNFHAFVGAIAPLLKADADLVVLCVGGGAFNTSERKFFSELQISDRLTQVEASDPELAALYHSARAFVFPSLYEGFGIPILEAFSCGCPCVLSSASCFPEIARDAALYFDVDDEDSMTESIRKALYDESLRRELIARGLQRNKMFSWQKTAKETLAVYRSLVPTR
jgi:glycosyltransferase involved in cell wall biosynthesis